MKYRTQNDGEQEKYSAAAQIHTGSDCLTRQEERWENDVNKLLEKQGAIIPREPVYGMRAMNLDLLDAHQILERAKEAHEALPAELKKEFPTVQSLLDAVDTGILKTGTDPETKKAQEEADLEQTLDREQQLATRRKRREHDAAFNQAANRPPGGASQGGSSGT